MNQINLAQQLQAAQGQLRRLLQEADAARTPTSCVAASLSELVMAIAELAQTAASVVENNAELLRSHEATAAQNELYRSLFENAPGSYLVTDSTGIIHVANPAAAALLLRHPEHQSHASPRALRGLSLRQFVASDSVAAFDMLLAQLPQSSTPLSAEINLIGGREPLCVLLSSVAKSDNGVGLSLRWLLHDITQRKQAELVLQQRIEQEHLMGAIAQRIRQSLNPQEILSNAVAEVRQFLQTDRVVVYHLEPSGAAVVVAEAVEPGWTPIVGSRLSAALTTERLTQLQQTHFLAVADTRQFSGSTTAAEVLQLQQVKAVMMAPIAQDAKLLGLLCVHQCGSTRHWKPVEIDLLNQLAAQVAIALQQSELYQRAQQLNLDLEQQVQQRTEQVQQALEFESMLKRITDKVRDSLDESQILQAAVQELTSVLGLSGCNAALYDLDQGISTIRYDCTSSIPASHGKVAQMDHFPEIYRQLQQGHYFQFCSLIPNPLRGQVAMLACPIFVDPNSSQGIAQAVLGDLWLINHRDHVFTEFEIRLVQQVANQCAIAIRQARLFQAAQAQVQELEKLNRLKDEFLSTVSHELRTPLSNVKMAIHMLKSAPDEERRRRYLKILETESAREAELIDDLLDLQRLEVASFAINLETQLLQQWLPEVVSPFCSRIAAHHQTLCVDVAADLSAMTSDFGILRRILAELLNNACKYTQGGNQIVLTVHQEATPAVTIFMLRNEAEIPLAELPNIFEKFYRVPHADPWKQGGTGLGLALVQKLVGQIQGTIVAESQDGWTTFTVRVPTQIDEG